MQVSNSSEMRVPRTAPFIAPLADGVERPMWSVVVPLYNSLEYLESTLRSVLIQDPGRDKMEIIVVDDCSTDGDVAAFVEQVGKGRIRYHRHKENIGLLRNFEACINLSKGHYIHMLHGDDEVMEGFYDQILSLFNDYPTMGAAFTEFEYIDKNGKKLWDNTPVSNQRGILENWLDTIAENQRLQFCSKVVKRSTYEKVGSFYGSLFAQDWIMWVKIAAYFQVAYSPKVLARYRRIDGNSTASNMRSGKNFENTLECLSILSEFIPAERRDKVVQKAKIKVAENHSQWAHNIYHEYHDVRSAINQVIKSLKLHTNFKVIWYSALLFVKVMIGYDKLKQIPLLFSFNEKSK